MITIFILSPLYSLLFFVFCFFFLSIFPSSGIAGLSEFLSLDSFHQITLQKFLELYTPTMRSCEHLFPHTTPPPFSPYAKVLYLHFIERVDKIIILSGSKLEVEVGYPIHA